MQQARFGLSVFVVNIIKVIFDFKLRLHEGRRSPAIIWLYLWFSSICVGEISQNCHCLWNCPADYLKPEKIGVTKAVSSLFAILCFLPLSQIWSSDFLLSTCSEGRAQICSTLQQILGKRDKSVCFACLVLRPRPDLTRSKNPILRVSRSYFNFRHSFWLTIAC